jgi:3-dehydroquinate synthase
MRAISQTIQVTFRYEVCFTSQLFHAENPLLATLVAPEDAGERANKLLFVVDGGVAAAHPGLLAAIEAYCQAHPGALRLAGPPLVIPGGEQCKNDPRYVELIQQAIHAQGICRHSYVVAIGGGALLDMAGYAAATAHRGVRLIRVPTTVLAQNDSAVGVKNSLNAFGKKNFLGSFAPPFAVINDRSLLATLDSRDWLGGLSEAIKVALLKDPQFFRFLEQHASRLVAREMSAMDWAIYRCAQLHLDHIARSGDPFEQGSSRPLDFGHWAAHKLEQLSRFRLRHGEAVAIGIALDATYSYLSGMLAEDDWRRVLAVFGALHLDVFAPELVRHLDDRDHPECVLRGLDEFREHLGGQLTITLLHEIGAGVEVHSIDEGRMARAIALLEAYQLSIVEGAPPWPTASAAAR